MTTKLNKNGQPVQVEPVVIESTNGKKLTSSGTIIFESKSQQLRYFEQTNGAKFIE
jgi:hypothetical protein